MTDKLRKWQRTQKNGIVGFLDFLEGKTLKKPKLYYIIITKSVCGKSHICIAEAMCSEVRPSRLPGCSAVRYPNA